MRKSDLHRSLQATAIAVPGKGGCYAVVPHPAPASVDVPACAAAFQMARRELDLLKGQLSRCAYADRLLRSLNRREAVDSSQIEGTRTRFDELLLYEMDLGDDANLGDADAGETLAYVDAATHGEEIVRAQGQSALNRQLLLDLHARLMAGNPRALPGRYRAGQTYIGGPRIENAVFIPPPPGEIEHLMADLENLLHYAPEGNLVSSILMRAAIAHAQFEAIHPFTDGNGRIGRMLLPLMLQAEGEPPIHLASFLKRRQGEYYEKLRAAQMRLDWTPWVGFFLDSIIASCRHTGQLIVEIDDIQAGWTEQLQARRKRRHATIWRVAELLPGQPVITAKEAARQLQVTFPAANDAIAELVEMDILRLSNAQRRNRAFQAHQILNAMHTGLDEVLQ